jgi:hypothetical protein
MIQTYYRWFLFVKMWNYIDIASTNILLLIYFAQNGLLVASRYDTALRYLFSKNKSIVHVVCIYHYHVMPVNKYYYFIFYTSKLILLFNATCKQTDKFTFIPYCVMSGNRHHYLLLCHVRKQTSLPTTVSCQETDIITYSVVPSNKDMIVYV